MLSSLAKYIFGGILKDSSPEENFECETREMDGWTLVNMPDQTIDDIEFEDDNDEDDVMLKRLKELNNRLCDKSVPNLDTSKAVVSSLIKQYQVDFQILPESLYLNHSLCYPSDFPLITSQGCTEVKDNLDGPTFFRMDFEPCGTPFSSHLLRLIHPHRSQAEEKPTRITIRERIAQRTPAITPKIDLVEQIQARKYGQRAMQYDLKKHISRSQLNRHNKNYIYEASGKRNRKKNLCRNPSGANNNRKC